MNITVIGCGRWGALLAWYFNKLDYQVTLYGRETSMRMQRFLTERNNGLVTLPETVCLSTDLDCIQNADVIVISIRSQELQHLMDDLKSYDLRNKIFVLCMKGLEIATGRRLSQIVEDNLDSSNKIAVWLGPGHAQEIYNKIPNCMVIDSKDNATKKLLINKFASNLIRFYYGQDLIGNEIGAASKNVVGIAAGMLDGLRISTFKGSLMTMGTREAAALIRTMGGNEHSAYGLCHLGDYEATLFSEYSHNRQFGESYIAKESYPDFAEGYDTIEAIMQLSKKHGLRLPLYNAVHQILYHEKDARTVLEELLSRNNKMSFHSFV